MADQSNHFKLQFSAGLDASFRKTLSEVEASLKKLSKVASSQFSKIGGFDKIISSLKSLDAATNTSAQNAKKASTTVVDATEKEKKARLQYISWWDTQLSKIENAEKRRIAVNEKSAASAIASTEKEKTARRQYEVWWEQQLSKMEKAQAQQAARVANATVVAVAKEKKARFDYVNWWESQLAKIDAANNKKAIADAKSAAAAATAVEKEKKARFDYSNWWEQQIAKLEAADERRLAGIQRRNKTEMSEITKRISLYKQIETLTEKDASQEVGLGSNLMGTNKDGLSNLRATITQLGTFKAQLGNSVVLRQRLIALTEKENTAQLRMNGSLTETLRKQKLMAGMVAGNTSDTIAERSGGQFMTRAAYAMSNTAYMVISTSVRKAIQSIVDFQQAQKDLQAITQATDDDIRQLSAEIQRVATTTKYSVVEVADAAKVIGQAGFSAVETMQVLSATMNLAQGTMESTTATADLLTTTIRSFSLTAADATQVADVMATAVNKSKLDIEKLRTVFNYIGPVAIDAGVSLQEMSAAVMTLANNGMKASTIGTSLRNVFAQLASPSKALRTEFQKIAGSEADLAKLTNKMTPMVDRFRILNKYLGTNSDLFKIFGLRAAGTVSILSKYPDLIQSMNDELYALGTAEQMAEKQMQGLGNRLGNLQAVIESTLNKFADAPASMFSDFIKLVTDLVIALGNLPGSVQSAIGTLVSLGGAFVAVTSIGRILSILTGTTLVGALTAFGTTLQTSVAALGTLNVATLTANMSLKGLVASMLAFAKTPMGIALLAITAGVGALATAFSLTEDKQKAATSAAKSEIKMLNEQASAIDRAITAYQNLGKVQDENGNMVSNPNDPTLIKNRQYLMEKMPDLSDMLLSETDTDTIIKNLQARGRQIKEAANQVGDDIVSSYAEKLTNSQDRIRKLLDQFDKVGESSKVEFHADYDFSEFGEEVVEQAKQTAAIVAPEVNKAIVAEFGNKQNFTDALKAVFQTEIDQAVEAARSRLAALGKSQTEPVTQEQALGVLNEEISNSTMLSKNYSDEVNSLRGTLIDLAKQMYATSTAIKSMNTEEADAFDSLRNASAGMSDAIIEQYNKMTDTISKGKLLDAVKTYSKKIAEIGKNSAFFGEQGTKDKMLAEEKKLYEEMYAIIESQYDAQRDLTEKQYELRMQQVKTAVAVGTMTEKEGTEALRAITQEKAKTEEEYILTIMSEMLNMAAKINPELNRLIDPDTPIKKQIQLWLTTNFDDLPAVVQGLFAGSKNLLGLARNYMGAQAEEAKGGGVNVPKPRKSGGGGAKFGQEEKRIIESIKADIEKMNAEAELAYEEGKTTFDEFVNSKIEGERRLMEARLKEVESLEAKAKTPEDKAEATKARSQYEMDIAKQRLSEIKERRDADKKRIEETRDEQILAYQEEESALKTSLTDGYKAAVETAKLTKKELEAELAALVAQRDSQMSINDRAELERSIREKILKINEADLELSTAILGNIEAQYKYGVLTTEEYVKRQNAQSSDPYANRATAWGASSNPFEGVKLGMQDTVLNMDTMNQTIASGVGNMVSSVSSSLDTMVDDFMSGTMSISDIMRDFGKNLVSTLLKTAMQIMANKIIMSVFSMFTGGIGGGESMFTSNWGSMGAGFVGAASAKGNAFKGGNLSSLSGSVVSKPTLFTYASQVAPFAKGGAVGLLGEAGSEAILPLRRTSSGSLGVESTGTSGGGVTNNINIETPSGYTAQQENKSNNQGGEDITVTFSKMMGQELSRPGSPMYNSVQNTFSARQALVKR